MKSFKIRPYRDPKRPHLKFVVNTTTVDSEGRKQRTRSFFETRGAAAGFAQQKSVELANGGLEAVQFPAALRVMASQADAMLKPYGKTILDAARHYLPILQAQNTSCTFAVLRDEILTSKKRDGASERYLGERQIALRHAQLLASASHRLADFLRGIFHGSPQYYRSVRLPQKTARINRKFPSGKFCCFPAAY